MHKKHYKEIVAQFYTTLKIILKENPECNELCELVYYDGKIVKSKLKIYLISMF